MTDLKRAPATGWVPDLSTFGARLAAVRQRMGWTNIKEAAEACAIAPQTWRQWEADKFEPRQLIHNCMKIAGVTGVDYRWLAIGQDFEASANTIVESQVGDTLRYPIGQRVVAVAGAKERTDSPDRTVVRARPIDARRHAERLIA